MEALIFRRRVHGASGLHYGRGGSQRGERGGGGHEWSDGWVKGSARGQGGAARDGWLHEAVAGTPRLQQAFNSACIYAVATLSGYGEVFTSRDMDRRDNVRRKHPALINIQYRKKTGNNDIKSFFSKYYITGHYKHFMVPIGNTNYNV